MHGQAPVPGISKHDLIYVSYNLKVPRYEPKIVSYRDFKPNRIDNFLKEGMYIPWHLIYNETNLDKKLEIFNNLLLEHINQHFPIKTARVTRPPAPWITNDIRILMKERDASHAAFRLSKLEVDKNRYKKLRNSVTYKLRKAKIQYYHKFFGAHRDSKSQWNILRNLGIGKIRSTAVPIIPLDELNNYFVNLAPCFNAHQKSKTIQELSNTLTKTPEQFYFTCTSPDIIFKIIKNLKSNASGSDNINAKLLKISMDVAIPAITDIVNYSLISGSFPNAWKTAFIHPLPKVASPSSPTDYRPISILPTLSKVLEKIVRHQIECYLDNNNIININQNGFRSGRNTGTALLNVIETVRGNIDVGKITVLVLLDFSKAFDSVDHDILLLKLKNIGFAEHTIKWFSEYLSHRKQVVISGKSKSKTFATHRGVAQGSVLGPLVFLIYVNDVGKSLKFCEYQMYADDLQIYLNGHYSEIISIVNKINQDLTSLQDWASSLGLVLNPSKSQCLIIGSRKSVNRLARLPVPHTTINNIPIPYVNSARNLGFHIENTLNWKTHADKTCQKVFSSLHSLIRLRNILPTSTRLFLVKSLIMPHFDYCDYLLTDINSSLHKRMQIAQNSCIRFIYDLRKYDHVSKYYQISEIFPLKTRRIFHSLLLLHKILNTKQPLTIAGQFKHLTQERARSSKLLCVPKHHTSLYNKSYTVSTTKHWNNLPRKIKSSKSFQIFKKSLISWLLEDPARIS